MKFDDYIKKQEDTLNVLSEEAKQSNVISDFFSNVSDVLKGGKPAQSTTISLKDKSQIETLKNLTNPTYTKAEQILKNMPPTPRGAPPPPITDSELLARIAINTVNIFNTNALAGGSLSLSLNQLTSKPEEAKGFLGTSTSRREVNVQSVSYQKVHDFAKKVLDTPIKKGIIKWDEFRELSPKDLFNRLTDNLAKGVWNMSGQSVAKM